MKMIILPSGWTSKWPTQ